MLINNKYQYFLDEDLDLAIKGGKGIWHLRTDHVIQSEASLAFLLSMYENSLWSPPVMPEGSEEKCKQISEEAFTALLTGEDIPLRFWETSDHKLGFSTPAQENNFLLGQAVLS